jgi:predicted TIM-barrel fold metal-dependent hydrolase
MSTASAAPTSPATPPQYHAAVRQDWLDMRKEEILQPGLPIVDPHHHLWDKADGRYLLDELLADTGSGHNIVATVFVQARAMLRASGPVEMQHVGETEFVNGVAAMSASGFYGKTRVCAGIVGHADLTLGSRVEPVLEAHIRAGGDRFRGIRYITAWDADTSVRNPAYAPPRGLLGDKAFREGFAVLGRLGLGFDAWLYHPQIGELADLARAFPETSIVLNHVGGPIGIGAYAGRHRDVFPVWAASIEALAACPNVCVKLGGLGMRLGGFGFHELPQPPSSETLAAIWRPYVETCIAAFGASRCMFESNFPVDKGSYSYPVFWNACKLLAKGASPAEKADLFAGTAARFYRLDL